jgi:hypothetical protein
MARSSPSSSPDGPKPIRTHPGAAPVAIVAVLVCFAGWLSVAAVSAGERAPAGVRTLGVYSVPTKTAFLDNADDRVRGEGHNPFGNPGPAVTPPPNEKLYGPFAGDQAQYAFTLYGDPDRRNRVGAAIFICQYGLDESSFCSASFRLAGGSLLSEGASTFEATKFTLGIVGGTSDYRGVTGSVQVAALGIATQAQPVYRRVPMLQSQHLQITLRPSPRMSARPQTLVRYSNVVRETFVNNDDDEARGRVNNPFGARIRKGAASKAGGGPFPGDQALFGFDVFSDAKLRTRAGSGVYNCQYSFAKRALCQATIELEGGTISVDGFIDFGASTWTMVVTGGTGKYSGRSGEVEATPDGRHAQRLAFRLG